MNSSRYRANCVLFTRVQLLSVLIGSFLLCHARAAELSKPGQESVFFAFDDQSIPWHDNLQVTMVPAEKYPGNPVLQRGPEGSPDHGEAILYGSVIRIEGKFHMWYVGAPYDVLPPGKIAMFWRPMCYAESDDGIHWTKPDLGLVEFNGNRHNNICLIQSPDPDLAKVDDYLTVIYEPQDPDPSRRYKVAYIAHYPWNEVKGGIRDVGAPEKRLGAMVCACSADGLTWTVLGDRPQVNEKYEVAGLYHFGNFYYVTGQQISPWTWLADGSKSGRSMSIYRSADFEHWSTAKVAGFQRVGQLTRPPIPGQQSHMGAGLWNRGNVLVGLYGMWQDAPLPLPKGKHWPTGVRIDLGVVISNDGLHFREPVPDFKAVARGPEGALDSEALLQAHAFANVGDKTYVWYSDWDTDKAGHPDEIGLAMFRRDGFGYLANRDPKAAAHCETTTITPAAGATRLTLNVDGVTTDKPMTVELLDGSAQSLPGYSGKDAAVIAESGTERDVIWPARKDGQLPTDREFAVRVNFPASGEARLYSLYLRP